jgi:hypothetical protein
VEGLPSLGEVKASLLELIDKLLALIVAGIINDGDVSSEWKDASLP